MKKTLLLITISILAINQVSAQTLFEFETAYDNGATITETINDITVTLSGDPDLELFPSNGFGGTTGNIALTQNSITSVTFTFDQLVKVDSIIAIESLGNTADYTFTPTGGSNAPVTVSLINGEAPTIILNWINVTSFTVTSTGAAFGFDNLSVDVGANGQTFFQWETAQNSGGTITETVNDIGVTLAGDASYSLTDYGNASGTSGNIILSNANRMSITFIFDDPVVVNSILALEGTGANIDYTFTPTGGDNAPVVASLVSGASAVLLKWSGVTSFTVTSSGGQFGFDNISVTGIYPTTIFDFDTNAFQGIREDCPDILPGLSTFTYETIDEITVTLVSDDCEKNIFLDLSASSTTGFEAARKGNFLTLVIVTFSQPVVLNSLSARDPLALGRGNDVDFTFTPIGGNNLPVTETLVLGIAPIVNLNWVNVTGFIITPSTGGWIYTDNISVNALIPLSVSDNQSVSQVTVFPNPVDNILYIKNNLNILSVKLYSLLGQEILQSKEAVIDVSQLSKGLYLLQIQTSEGMETKRIIKR